MVTSGQAATFTTTGAGRTVTAPSGGIEQVIEGASIGGGTYVINWTGTASCIVNGVSRVKGSTFTLTAGSNATVRFSSGTVTDVQIEPGQVVTAFELRPAAVELMLCQQYCLPLGLDGSSTLSAGGYCTGTTALLSVPVPVEMRAAPTYVGGTLQVTTTAGTTSVSGISKRSGQIIVTAGSTAPAGESCFLVSSTSTGFRGFEAEL